MKTCHLATTVVVALLGVAGVVLRIRQPAVKIAPRMEVHFDDWFFSVQKVEKAADTLYVATVRVRSEAKRVDFGFDPASIRFTLDGRRLPLVRDVSESGRVTVGETRDFRLAFRGPTKGSIAVVKFEADGASELLDELVGENYEVVAKLSP